MITVTAGSCTTVIVGTRADARSQGFFASHPTDVTVLIGSGVTLKVNSVQLSAAQVQTIMDATSGNPNGVSASSNVLLTLVQQLITAALNILEGVVAPPTVLAALGQANAAIQVSVSGTSTAVTTSLSKAQLSALVETLTAFNEGKSGTPGNGTASVGVVEGGGTATTVIAIVCNPAAACANTDLAGRSVTAVVTTGATTEVQFTNETNLGSIKICKVAGTGITNGQVFTFDVTVGSGTPFTVNVAAGQCTTVDDVPNGTNVHIAEELSSSFQLELVACNPGCTNIDLATASADVSAAAATEKTVTFTNRSAA